MNATVGGLSSSLSATKIPVEYYGVVNDNLDPSAVDTNASGAVSAVGSGVMVGLGVKGGIIEEEDEEDEPEDLMEGESPYNRPMLHQSMINGNGGGASTSNAASSSSVSQSTLLMREASQATVQSLHDMSAVISQF